MVLYRRRSAADPVRIGLPEFSNAPLKKRLSWCPRSPQLEEDKSVHYLMGRIRLLAHAGLTMIEVMATCIMRGGAATAIQGPPLVGFQRGGRCHPVRSQGAGFRRHSNKDLIFFVQGRRRGIPLCQPTGRILYVQSSKLDKRTLSLA